MIRFLKPFLGREWTGTPYIQGHIEIFHEGIWGAICDDHMNDAAATVLCKMAGYPHGGKYSEIYQQLLSNKANKIWLDDLRCTGFETNVSGCNHRPWGMHDCSHHEEVGIRCFTDPGMWNFTLFLITAFCITSFTLNTES